MFGALNNVTLFADVQNLLNSQVLVGNSYSEHGRNIAFGFKIAM